MNSNFSFKAKIALSLLLACFATGQAMADDWPPKVTSDGLTLVEGTEVAAVWKLEGADFSDYKRVMIVDVGVAFIKNWRRDYNQDQMGLRGQISQTDADKIKQRVADEVKTVFTNELTAAGYEVSNYNIDLAGHDVLVIRPAIADLDVKAPDTGKAGTGRTYTASAGAMTLYMDFFDSVTSQLIGRVVDRKAARDDDIMSLSSSASNKVEADRMIKKWTGLLIARMDQVMGKPETESKSE